MLSSHHIENIVVAEVEITRDGLPTPSGFKELVTLDLNQTKAEVAPLMDHVKMRIVSADLHKTFPVA